MQGNDGKFARLIHGDLNYLGPVDLSQYFVQDYSITDNQTFNGLKGVKVDFILSRRLLSHYLTTFLPAACICVVAFTTNYFQVKRESLEKET